MNIMPDITSIAQVLAQIKIARDTSGNTSSLRYFKPKLGEDLLDLQKTQVMMVRQLTIQHRHAIPMHRNARKEKVFVHDGQGIISVCISDEHGFVRRILTKPGDSALVPAGSWHCVICEQVNTGNSGKLLIIGSSLENDVEWEPATGALLENKS